MYRFLASLMFLLIVMDISAEEFKARKPFIQLGHSSTVTSISISSNSKYMISGSFDKNIKLWDIKTGKVIRTFRGDKYKVESVAFSPNSKYIISAGLLTLKLWDMKTAKVLRIFKGHKNIIKSVAFSPDGKYAISGSKDSTMKLWDIKTGKKVRTFKGDKEEINSVSFGPNGKYVIYGSKKLIKGSGDWDDKNNKYIGVIKLWDITTGKEIRAFKNLTSIINSVAYSPNGKYAVSGDDDGSMILWNIKTGKKIKIFNNNQEIISSVAFSKNGKYAISGSWDGSIKLWDIKTGKEIKTFNGSADIIFTVAFSPNGKYIVSGTDSGTISLWNAKTAMKIDVFKEEKIMDNSLVRITKDGKNFITKKKLWDMKTGAVVKDFRASRFVDTIKNIKYATKKTVAIAPNNKTAISIDHLKSTLKQWDLKTGKTIKIFNKGYDSYTDSVAISSNGKYMSSVSSSKNAKLWDIQTGKIIISFKEPSTALDFSPDSRYAIYGSYSRTLKLVDIKKSKVIKTFKGHQFHINSVAFSPNGKYIVSGANDGTIKLWDIKTSKNIRTYNGGLTNPISVVISPNGKYILSGNSDKTVNIWNLKTGEELLKVISYEDGEWLSITPQGYFNASKNGAKHLNILTDSMTVTGIDAFYDKFYRPDIVRKVLAGETITQRDTLQSVIKTKPAPSVEILRVSETMEANELIDTTSKQYVYVTVKVTAKGGTVGDVKIFNNSIAVKTDNLRSLKLKKKNKSKYKKYKVYLKRGKNTITVQATNIDGSMRSNVETHIVEAKLKKVKSKNLHAVIIGIDKFTDSSNNLTYTVKDAKAFAKLLKATAKKSYKNVDIKLLITKKETTKKNIKKVLKKYAKTVNTNDTFLFYGATHGFVDELDGKYYFITSDYDGELSNSIDRDTLVSLLSNIKMQNKLIILDTCYSSEGSADMITDLVNPSLSKIANNGISIFAGSGTKQEALDGYKGHGLFTYTLLEGLRNIKKIGNADKTLTVSELGGYVENQVPIYADKINFIQTPLFEKRGSNFEIGKK